MNTHYNLLVPVPYALKTFYNTIYMNFYPKNIILTYVQ